MGSEHSGHFGGLCRWQLNSTCGLWVQGSCVVCESLGYLGTWS